MPIDIIVAYADGTQESYYVPLQMMHYIKNNPFPKLKRNVLGAWDWAWPTFEFTITGLKPILR